MTFTNAEGTVNIGNNDEISSFGYGTVRLTTIVKGGKSTIMMMNTLYTLDVIYHLVSLSNER